MADSQLELFMKEFMILDKNGDGELDRNELEAFHNKNGHSKQQIAEWMKKFDVNKDNKITFDEFARALGAKKNEIKRFQSEYLEEARGKKVELDEGITIIEAQMPMVYRKAITSRFKQFIDQHIIAKADKNTKMDGIVAEMRNFLDQTYSPKWHCLIVEGSYWVNYIHEPLHSIMFSYKQFTCVAWRTSS